MAQDFHANFGCGPDDRHISLIDADGVALAAIQGLNRKLESALAERDAKISALQNELNNLKSLIVEMRNQQTNSTTTP